MSCVTMCYRSTPISAVKYNFLFILQAQPLRKEPEVITVTLKKQNGMGLSIVAAKVGQSRGVSMLRLRPLNLGSGWVWGRRCLQVKCVLSVVWGGG